MGYFDVLNSDTIFSGSVSSFDNDSCRALTSNRGDFISILN